MEKTPAAKTTKKEIPKGLTRALAERKANAICRLVSEDIPQLLGPKLANCPITLLRPPKSSGRSDRNSDGQQRIWNLVLILGSSRRFLGNALHRRGEDRHRRLEVAKKIGHLRGIAPPLMRRRANVASGSGLDDLTGFPLSPDPTRSPTNKNPESETEVHHARRTCKSA
jgi:hypothetical protein